MKLLGRNFENDGSGSVDLVPEDSEDLWHLYNLVAVGDKVKCKTVRKVTTESSTGSTASTKKLITIKIGVQSIDYDTQAGQLRLKGQNEMESEHIRMGAFHTAEIEPHQKLTIEKNCWDAIYLDRLQEATDHAARADVAAVILQEGVAHVCLITSNMTIVKQRIETSIPRKRKSGSTQHDKGLLRFYEQILQSIQRNVRWDVVKAFLVASPGFIKDDLFKYIMDEAVKREMKDLLENKGKFVLCHSSTGFKHSLKEVMQDKAVASKLADTKAAGETKALDDFYEMLSNDPDRALYGPDHCFQAAEKDAIDILLISDSLFRSQDIAQRRRYVTLVEKVRETNGEVKVFSSLHVSGEQLTQLTGVAAILRFPCPEIGNDSDDES